MTSIGFGCLWVPYFLSGNGVPTIGNYSNNIACCKRWDGLVRKQTRETGTVPKRMGWSGMFLYWNWPKVCGTWELKLWRICLAIKIILEPLVLLVSRYSTTDHGSSSGEAYILWYIPGKIPEALENYEAVKNSMTKKKSTHKAWGLVSSSCLLQIFDRKSSKIYPILSQKPPQRFTLW